MSSSVAARPYLISGNTQLQSEDGALVQRGDLLATLILRTPERPGTSSRVCREWKNFSKQESRKNAPSSLRKPDEPAFVHDEDAHRLFLVYGEGNEEEIVIPAGLEHHR